MAQSKDDLNIFRSDMLTNPLNPLNFLNHINHPHGPPTSVDVELVPFHFLFLSFFLSFSSSFFLSFLSSLIHKICFIFFFIILYLLLSIAFFILQGGVFDDKDIPERSLECHGVFNEVEGHERFLKGYNT